MHAACAALPDERRTALRLAVRPDGEIVVQTGAAGAAGRNRSSCCWRTTPTRSDDLFLRHKTSIRSRYDAAWRAAESAGAFDTLFFNERGELTEGGRSNVFVRIGGRWYTPPLSSGVLPGVMRARAAGRSGLGCDRMPDLARDPGARAGDRGLQCAARAAAACCAIKKAGAKAGQNRSTDKTGTLLEDGGHRT